MNKKIIKYIYLPLLTTLIAACNRPEIREKMLSKNEVQKSTIAQWDKGEAMAKEGTELVKKGEKMIDEGNKEIKNGNKKIFQGNNIMQTCEATFWKNEMEASIEELDEH